MENPDRVTTFLGGTAINSLSDLYYNLKFEHQL